MLYMKSLKDYILESKEEQSDTVDFNVLVEEIDKAFEQFEAEVISECEKTKEKYELESDDKIVKSLKNIYSANKYLRMKRALSEQVAEKMLSGKIENLVRNISEVETETFIGRLVKFVGEEILSAINNGDLETSDEIERNRELFEAYVRAFVSYDEDDQNWDRVRL